MIDLSNLLTAIANELKASRVELEASWYTGVMALATYGASDLSWQEISDRANVKKAWLERRYKVAQRVGTTLKELEDFLAKHPDVQTWSDLERAVKVRAPKEPRVDSRFEIRANLNSTYFHTARTNNVDVKKAIGDVVHALHSNQQLKEVLRAAGLRPENYGLK